MIQIGSKEEVALLLALFGPIPSPSGSPGRNRSKTEIKNPCRVWPTA